LVTESDSVKIILMESFSSLQILIILLVGCLCVDLGRLDVAAHSKNGMGVQPLSKIAIHKAVYSLHDNASITAYPYVLGAKVIFSSCQHVAWWTLCYNVPWSHWILNSIFAVFFYHYCSLLVCVCTCVYWNSNANWRSILNLESCDYSSWNWFYYESLLHHFIEKLSCLFEEL
jgi:hypothetical protein